MLKLEFKRVMLLLISIILITFYSCKENHIHEPEEHFEAEGVVFYQSGIKIAEVFRGVTTDTLFAEVNREGAHTEVKFYDKDKKILNPPDYKKNPMAWQISDTTVVKLKQHAGEAGSYGFHLEGKRVGITDIEFFIMHAGHADFRSGKIPVKVR